MINKDDFMLLMNSTYASLGPNEKAILKAVYKLFLTEISIYLLWDEIICQCAGITVSQRCPLRKPFKTVAAEGI